MFRKSLTINPDLKTRVEQVAIILEQDVGIKGADPAKGLA
jgi:hypothetical protein